MKKLFTLFLALVMIVSMAACGKTDAPDNSGDNAEKATYRVGVCQLAQHPALDAATQGFVDALKEELGDDVNIEVQNASGESNNCSTIINGFLSSDVDLIMANATPALTAAASATSEVPFWARPLRLTAWRWIWMTLAAPWAATSPVPPTLPIWRSRPPW